MMSLVQVYGNKVTTVPKIVVTDFKNLEYAIVSATAKESNFRLVPDVVIIMQTLENDMATHVQGVVSERKLASCLKMCGSNGLRLFMEFTDGVLCAAGGQVVIYFSNNQG